MKRSTHRNRYPGLCLCIWFLLFASDLMAQSILSNRSRAVNLVVPQSRAFTLSNANALEIVGVAVDVEIFEQMASTVMEISMRNRSGSRQEAELLVPVPDGVVVKGFDFQGAGAEPSAHLLPHEEARRIYNDIVAKMRDPALLEFAGYNLVRSSVFPVEPGGMQRVRLTYEHLLPADGARIDYRIPRSESIDYTIPWEISVRIRSSKPVSTVYSPSHHLMMKRLGPGDLSLHLAEGAPTEPGPFQVSILLEQNDQVSASLFAYPEPKIGGGYFLLLAGLPPQAFKNSRSSIRREVILVLDRSGSMRGEKFEQVRDAAFKVISNLDEGEAFNIITYNEHVDQFSGMSVRKTSDSLARARRYLIGTLPRGGTNIHDALVEALMSPTAPGMLPIVIFLTDGLPTMGETSEQAICELAVRHNRFDRRIFTIGVGFDVNTPLLDKIARATRATAAFVLPGEAIDVKIEQVFKRLHGPILAAPSLEVFDAEGRRAGHRVGERIPSVLPDLFEGDQLVVLGTYHGDDPLTFVLQGDYLGTDRAFRFSFSLDHATTRNAFVPRLWASRKIAVLVDAIRERGAEGTTDPRIRELVDEVVRLSTEFGILTEYTAFLAREGTDLGRRDRVLAEAMENFRDRAMMTRQGEASLNQEFNMAAQRAQTRLNFKNRYLDRNLNRVDLSDVQQLNDRAFYKQGKRWVDSRIVDQARSARPEETIDFGTHDFDALLARLAGEGRQGILSLAGEIVVEIDGKVLMIRSVGTK